ncbi:MAG: riboflavin biosynthesis protein RibF [Porphyromonadaceae bacterium]|nr:riboflavin biosynthesis protein RibF [Porphyromonadaceae bacterium]
MAQEIIATVGAFDGIHLGHRALLNQLRDLSEVLGLVPVVFTFSPHPAEMLRPELAPPHLAPLEQNVELLRRYGVERVEILAFTPELASRSAEEFMLELRDRYGLKALLVGYDHQFGRGANLTYEDYEAIGRRLGITLYQGSSLRIDDAPVSSSRIRQLLGAGKTREANAMLGYTYRFSGQVVGGMRIGRTMGYPTANIRPDDPRQLIPADGVYAVRVRIAQCMHTGMLYIGKRPTLDGAERTIEVNIFDLSADLYAQRLELHLETYVRPDCKFPSLEALQDQIARDEQFVRAYFAS